MSSQSSHHTKSGSDQTISQPSAAITDASASESVNPDQSQDPDAAASDGAVEAPAPASISLSSAGTETPTASTSAFPPLPATGSGATAASTKKGVAPAGGSGGSGGSAIAIGSAQAPAKSSSQMFRQNIGQTQPAPGSPVANTGPPAPTPVAAATQAGLGRGRAPTLHSLPGMSSMAGSSPSRPTGPSYAAATAAGTSNAAGNSRMSNTSNNSATTSGLSLGGRPHGQAGPGQGHRSMPSTSHSITFSDLANPPASATWSSNVPGGGAQTDAESIFSGDEEYGSTAYPYSHQQQYLAQHQQQPQPGGPARRSRIPLNHAASNISTGSRILNTKAGTGQLRPPSLSRNKPSQPQLRDRSRSRARESSSSSSDDGGSTSRRRPVDVGDDSVNVLPVTLQPSASNVGMEDDAIERRDRGEELIRRRARERKKEKKEAEKRERKRRDEEARKERQLARNAKGAAGTTGDGLPIPPPPAIQHRESITSDAPTSYDERPTFSRRSTDPSNVNTSRSQFLSREPSGATAIPYSPWGPPAHTGNTQVSSTPTPHSPFFPPPHGNHHQNRTVSYAPSNVSRTDQTERDQDVFSEAEREEELDRVPDLQGQGRNESAAWRDEVARSMKGEEASSLTRETADNDEEATEAVEEQQEEEEEEDEDEDDSNEDVEYTLKDRQDAINIEHPFGLPIWKPALYKKDRSVTRNADKDLHLAPSSVAEWHLLPGNIAWTVLFGWWMALFFTILAAILALVPFGGAKYGRVLWELASYLFWPFGKYVERCNDEGAEEYIKGYDEMSDDGDETVYEERTTMPNDDDLEGLGRTWGRASGRSTDSSKTARRIPSPQRFERTESTASTPLLPSDQTAEYQQAGGNSPSPNRIRRSVSYAAGTSGQHERTDLLDVHRSSRQMYGATATPSANHGSSGSETEVASPNSPRKGVIADAASRASSLGHFRVRALGRLCWWAIFYLLIAPILLFVCLLCWGLVFSVPMAKVLWILIQNLGTEPLALHFRSPSPHYAGNNNLESGDAAHPPSAALPHLEAGQPAPRHSRKTYEKSREMGRLLGPDSTIILCTYKAVGLKYYKYTIDGINIVFINLLPLILFVIFDFFVIERYVEHHHLKTGFLAFISGQAMMFVLALLSVIPLSYFIGMAVASISAQSSIGMGAVINATFGSIIEIILYSIALTQAKGQLVEGSIVGSLLAGVLLMPGLSMIGGAVRRKEQRFNAKSAGVTSTMLIMAIIGILTPTLFYEIYGTFQLTCSECPNDSTPDNFSCRRCFYEHVDPVDDVFYQTHVKGLSFYCAAILVLSYLIGLWFSLRTHASQIWQNQQPITAPHTAIPPVVAGLSSGRPDLAQRQSMYKRLPQAVTNLLPGQRHSMVSSSGEPSSAQRPRDSMANTSTPLGTPGPYPHQQQSFQSQQAQYPSFGRKSSAAAGMDGTLSLPMQLPAGMTAEEVNRAFQVVAATASAFQSQQKLSTPQQHPPTLRHQPSHVHERELSRGGGGLEAADGGGHGGHDAPNWSRLKSYSVLLGCTVLYAIIAEILVDVVDVVLDGSGIPEKFLGVTLFALVPNTTEFMNAISFAMNGNIALSMEIGSAYAIQVCLLQIPAMVAFTWFYGIGKDSMVHRAFTLIFPRWDALAIMFSVFLLTYTYIEARSNYYRGSILVLSYMVLLGGFFAAPANMDTEDDPLFAPLSMATAAALPFFDHLRAIIFTLFSR